MEFEISERDCFLGVSLYDSNLVNTFCSFNETPHNLYPSNPTHYEELYSDLPFTKDQQNDSEKKTLNLAQVEELVKESRLDPTKSNELVDSYKHGNETTLKEYQKEEERTKNFYKNFGLKIHKIMVMSEAKYKKFLKWENFIDTKLAIRYRFLLLKRRNFSRQLNFKIINDPQKLLEHNGKWFESHNLVNKLKKLTGIKQIYSSNFENKMRDDLELHYLNVIREFIYFCLGTNNIIEYVSNSNQMRGKIDSSLYLEKSKKLKQTIRNIWKGYA